MIKPVIYHDYNRGTFRTLTFKEAEEEMRQHDDRALRIYKRVHAILFYIAAVGFFAGLYVAGVLLADFLGIPRGY